MLGAIVYMSTASRIVLARMLHCTSMLDSRWVHSMIDGASRGGCGGSSAHRVDTRSHTGAQLVAQSFMMEAVD